MCGSTGVLVSGTVAAQGILVLASPFLLRLYAPSSIGILAAIMGFVSVATVVASLRYELAVPLAKQDRHAEALVVLSVTILTVASVIAGIAFGLLGEEIGHLLGVANLGSAKWLIPAALFSAGMYSICSYWCIRRQAFAAMAKGALLMALSTTAMQLMLFRMGFLGLLVGQVAGNLIGALALCAPTAMWAMFKKSTYVDLIRQAKFFRNFPTYSTWEGLANTVSHQVAPIALALYFTPAAAGVFAVAHRFLSIPVALVGSAIGHVFFASIAKKDRAEIRREFETTSAKLTLIGMPCFALMALGSPQIITLLFGANWTETGQLVRWMAPWFYFQFISSPMSLLFSVVDHQRDGMLWQWMLLLLRLAALGLGIASSSLLQTVVLFSLASVAAYLLQLVWLARLAEANIWTIARRNCVTLIYSLAICSPVLIGNWFFDTKPGVRITCLVAGCILLLAYEIKCIAENVYGSNDHHCAEKNRVV